MPLTTVEIEQISASPEQWVAKIEVGGMICKRCTVTAASHDGILAATGVAYRELAGIPEPGSIRAHQERLERVPTDRLPPLRDSR